MKRLTALALLAIAQLITQSAHAQATQTSVYELTTQEGIDQADAHKLQLESRRGHVLPVAGHPYTADEVTQVSRTLSDGNRIESSQRHQKMRDSEGRWRNSETGLTLYTRMVSPRSGERIIRLENLRLEDVPASAFVLPAEYAVRDVSAPRQAAE